MITKRMIVLIVSLPLCLLLMGVGFWVMTEPQEDPGSAEAKQCREYVEDLDMVNRYKLFWSFVQRRMAYNNCIARIAENRLQPKTDHPQSK